MSSEPVQAALARWGDSGWQSALLATNRRTVAETITVAAWSRVLAASPTDLQLAFCTELARRQSRARFRDSWRNRTLPRPLRRIAPRDRVLLGLWLLHECDGARLALIADQSPPALIARMSTVIFRAARRYGTIDRLTDPACLGPWLAARLGLALDGDPHACEQCDTSATAWQATLDALRADFRAAVGQAHLPQAVINMIEARLHANQLPAAWWQQRRRLLPALIVCVGVAIAVLVRPGAPQSPAAPMAQPASIRDLVRQTRDQWSAFPTTGTRHWQVRAVEPGGAQEPTITDVWLAPATSGRHHIEVRRGNTLIEAQTADGNSLLMYTAVAGASACPLNAALDQPQGDQSALLRLSPADQRAVRDARLRMSGYGVGFQALEQALIAPDLRAFGLRREDERQIAVAAYTDAASDQQRLLLIDPALRQLVAVQAMTTVSGQVQIRDLWRLLARDDGSALPAASTAPSSVALNKLIDPACPALKAEALRSLYTLTDTLREPWYLPRTLPAGLTRAAILTSDVPGPSDDGSDAPPYNVVFWGSERSLRLSATTWRPNPGGAGDVQRGPWRVAVHRRGSDVWHGVLRRALGPTQPAFVPTIEIVARGWAEDELMTVIDALTVVDAEQWRDLRTAFLDPQPLPAPTEQLFVQALDALRQPATGTLYSATRITTRVGPEKRLDDPFYVPNAARNPPVLLGQQWLVADDQAINRFRDVYTLPDGTLHHALVNDGARITSDQRADGWSGDEPVKQIAAEVIPQQPGSAMLTALLSRPEPIAQAADGAAWRLTQTINGDLRTDMSGRNRPVTLIAGAPNPWLDDLAGGTFVQRLWIDQTTFMPQRYELAVRAADGSETRLQQIELLERRVEATPPTNLGVLPPLPDDVLRFNATAYRWQQARNANQPMSVHWLMSSLNFDPAAHSTLKLSPQDAVVRRMLVWPSTANAQINWQLAAATSLDQINVGTLHASTWHDLSNISALYRTQYALAGNTITLTQGPRTLLRNMLRYAPVGDRWTSSERLTVNVAGAARTAWLLRDDQHSTAVLVIEVDDVLVHINGPLSFLRGALQDELRTLEWTNLMTPNGQP